MLVNARIDVDTRNAETRPRDSWRTATRWRKAACVGLVIVQSAAMLGAQSLAQSTSVAMAPEMRPVSARVQATLAGVFAPHPGAPGARPGISIRHRAVLQLEPTASSMPSTSAHRTLGRRLAGAVTGVIGGWYIGGFVGRKLERDCGCSDQGIAGFVTGGLIGAALGGFLGEHFLF